MIMLSLNFNAQSFTTSKTVYDVSSLAWNTWVNTGGTFDGITFTTNGSNFGSLTSGQNVNFADIDENGNSVNINSTRSFQYGGVSYSGSAITPVGAATPPTPSRRLVSLTVPAVPAGGKVEVKIYGNISSSTSGRQIVVVDKAYALLGFGQYDLPYDANIGKITKVILNNSVTDNLIYILAAIGDSRIYRIEVITYTPDGTLSTTSAKKIDAKIFTTGKTVNIRDLKAKNSEIKVYNLNGNLIKSFKTLSSDTQFELSNGMYIVNIKSEEGEKSVKISIK